MVQCLLTDSQCIMAVHGPQNVNNQRPWHTWLYAITSEVVACSMISHTQFWLGGYSFSLPLYQHLRNVFAWQCCFDSSFFFYSCSGSPFKLYRSYIENLEVLSHSWVELQITNLCFLRESKWMDWLSTGCCSCASDDICMKLNLFQLTHIVLHGAFWAFE